MNKKELIDRISATGFTKTDTSRFIEAFTAAVTGALMAGDKVTLQDFGTFDAVWRAPRTGKNPNTGQTVAIPGQFVPRFTPGKRLRRNVHGRRNEPSINETDEE